MSVRPAEPGGAPRLEDLEGCEHTKLLQDPNCQLAHVKAMLDMHHRRLQELERSLQPKVTSPKCRSSVRSSSSEKENAEAAADLEVGGVDRKEIHLQTDVGQEAVVLGVVQEHSGGSKSSQQVPPDEGAARANAQCKKRAHLPSAALAELVSVTEGSRKPVLKPEFRTQGSFGDKDPAGLDARTLMPTSSTGQDPFSHMVNSASLNQKHMFDEDLLKSIYNKPYKRARHNAALVGSVVGGVMSLPFGPIGMAAGAMVGALLGAVVGLIIDQRRTRKKLQQSELEKKRLKSLVRWAAERINEDDELKLIEMVTLEFKPIADIATGSKNARKLLKLLDGWISQKHVQRNLWVYMDQLLQQWRDLTRGEFLRSMLVFQTLATMYRHSNRALDQQEAQFLARMERLLEHASVKSVMNHAQLFPTQGNCRVMESMVYADAARQRRRLKSGSGVTDGLMTPPCMDEASERADEAGEASDDSDEELRRSDSHGGSWANAKGTSPKMTPLHSEEPEPSSSEGAKRKLTLKKPFFRDWQDFMDFDLTFKHRMPITISEFGLLLEKERESTKGWDVCIDRKDMRVAKVQYGVGGITVRAWATLPGIDMHAAFHVFFDINERVKWDTVFAKMDLIDTNAQGSDVLYSLMRIPGVTARDFLQYRRVRVQEDGAIVIVLRSAEHTDMPEVKGVIRAESYISGYILRQTYEGSTPVLSIFLMSCVDVKGMIPKWIINFLAPKKPSEWITSLKKATMEYQEQCPDFKERERQAMARFSVENPFDYEQESDSVGDKTPDGVALQVHCGVPSPTACSL